MIVVTGAAGFIGSNFVGRLNADKFNDVVLVDDFSSLPKCKNYETKTYTELVERKNLTGWLKENHRFVQIVIHLGARTDTTEFNKAIFDELNLEYSKDVCRQCIEFGLPFIYASSAATYGDGALGYDDNHEIVNRLMPLNPYGESKNEFDKWILAQDRTPFFWAGLKFFNVYGPNEYHKGRMASVILHAFKQIKENGNVKLFRSHNPNYKDGGQLRDFIYVKDICDVIMFLMQKRPQSGIFNLGTGKARSFIDLATATFHAMNKPVNIEFIDTPIDIRDKYQYFTEARMDKLRSVRYNTAFTNLEDGIKDYVCNYLIPSNYL